MCWTAHDWKHIQLAFDLYEHPHTSESHMSYCLEKNYVVLIAARNIDLNYRFTTKRNFQEQLPNSCLFVLTLEFDTTRHDNESEKNGRMLPPTSFIAFYRFVFISLACSRLLEHTQTYSIY